jgi:hypothetical protein
MNHRNIKINSKHLIKLNKELGEHQPHYYNGKAKLGTASATAVIADTSPTPIADPDERGGWLFTKTVVGAGKFNYYFYGRGNKAVTLGELQSVFANVSIDNYQGQSSLPFFNIYTKLQASGNAGAWYHSKITYTLDAEELIMLGEDVEMWSISQQQKNHKNKRMVSANTKSVEGEGLDSEEIYSITIQSDSGAPASTQILVNNVGYTIVRGNDIINRRISLI